MTPRLLTGITAALAIMASLSWAASNLNSSKSNLNRLTYDTRAVTAAQAALILKDLDAGGGLDEARVRQVLRARGINAPNLLLIRIVPAGQRRERLPLILLLTNPADEAQGLAVSDPGSSADDYKPKKPTR